MACEPGESHGAHGGDPFIAENGAAMDRMMDAMSIEPTGNVDSDFVAMMVPHHQGAIDMAVIYLRYGKDERLRRIAQEIVVTQKDEIAAMHLVVDPQPAQAPNHHPHGH